jgi:hypothetical protein
MPFWAPPRPFPWVFSARSGAHALPLHAQVVAGTLPLVVRAGEAVERASEAETRAPLWRGNVVPIGLGSRRIGTRVSDPGNLDALSCTHHLQRLSHEPPI